MSLKAQVPFRVPPESWMKVRWSHEREIKQASYREALRDLIKKYGQEEMSVVSQTPTRTGWLVTLSRGSNMLREDSENPRSELLRVHWMYLQPA